MNSSGRSATLRGRAPPTRAGGGAGAPSPSPTAEDSAALLALETQIRTLRVEPYTLLTLDERRDQATRHKAMTGRKRAAAFPGDPDVDAEDVSLNPFAEWPYEQSLKFELSYSYSLCGRLLRNALRWCNRYFTDGLAQITWTTQQTTATALYGLFNDAVGNQRHDQALLLASKAAAEATIQMTAIVSNAQGNATRFPQSKMLQHIAARRALQALELKVFLADVAQRITDALKDQDEDGAALATASWIDFLDGWLSKTDKSLVSAESLKQALTSPGGSASGSPGSSSPGGILPNFSGVSPPKVARTAGAAGTSSGGGSRAASPATPPPGTSPALGKICIFRNSVPCSVDIVGETLGVSGSPFCGRCKSGHHYHGECPLEWGKLGRPLPGFADDGTRIDKAWCKHEPIQRVAGAPERSPLRAPYSSTSTRQQTAGSDPTL